MLRRTLLVLALVGCSRAEPVKVSSISEQAKDNRLVTGDLGDLLTATDVVAMDEGGLTYTTAVADGRFVLDLPTRHQYLVMFLNNGELQASLRFEEELGSGRYTYRL